MLAGIVTMLMLPAVSAGAASGGNEQVARATGAYAVVVARRTYDDEQWKQVVEALVKKYDAKVVVYDKDVREARKALAEQMPNYACFVTPPDRAGRKFVIAVHRMTRELDDDPYTDVIWGILTGYTPGDALRTAFHRQGAKGALFKIAHSDGALCYKRRRQQPPLAGPTIEGGPRKVPDRWRPAV